MLQTATTDNSQFKEFAKTMKRPLPTGTRILFLIRCLGNELKKDTTDDEIGISSSVQKNDILFVCQTLPQKKEWPWNED